MTRNEQLFAALGASEYHRVCEAIETLADRVRLHELDPDEVEMFGNALVERSSHAKWEVRRAVALALRYVGHDNYGEVIEKLRRDTVGRVKKAAEDTIGHRTERVQLDLLPLLHDEKLEAMLNGLERQHSGLARKAALRVGVAYATFLFRGLCHELGRSITPLEATLDPLDDAIRSGSTESALERAKYVRDRVAHMHRIVKNSRTYVLEAPSTYDDRSARELVDRAVETTRKLACAREQGLELRIEVEDDLRFEVDPDLVQQAFENLLKNAAEASKVARPIRIEVKAKKVKGRLEFAFTDHGCGMTRDAVDALFRPYKSQKEGGTGLGMPIVRKIVELDHGGRVRVTSAPSVGTTVTLMLPVRQEGQHGVESS